MGSINIKPNHKVDEASFKPEIDIGTIEVSRKTSSDASTKIITVHEIGGVRVIGLTDEGFEFYDSFSPAMRSKVKRKIDIRLIPLLGLLYLVSNIDRVNIGNAKIEGMDLDLNLTGVQYNVALSIFFVSYILMEIPSNIILKQISRPSWYLGGMATMFGVITMCTGFVKNFSELAGLRFVLGIFEAGFLPAAIFLCSVWYNPEDLAARIGGMYICGAMSGAFGGLLAAGLTQMDGIGGIVGWRWIFIIQGLVTVVIGILATLFLIDLPSKAMGWLDPLEMRFLDLQRKIKQGGLKMDGADIEGGELGFGGLYELKMVYTNWRMWMLAFIIFCEACGVYGMKFALPTITKEMGFSSTNAQLLSAPPYIAGGVGAIVIPWLSDRYKQRATWNAFCFVLMLVSNCIIIGFQGRLGGANLGASYTFNMISAIGVYGAAPILLAWASNNTAPAGRRAVVAAWMIAFGNVGGIVGSFMYLDREAPAYNTGFGLMASLSFAALIGSAVLWMSWRNENKKRDKVSEDQVKALYSDQELLRMGDRSPLFRYML